MAGEWLHHHHFQPAASVHPTGEHHVVSHMAESSPWHLRSHDYSQDFYEQYVRDYEVFKEDGDDHTAAGITPSAQRPAQPFTTDSPLPAHDKSEVCMKVYINSPCKSSSLNINYPHVLE